MKRGFIFVISIMLVFMIGGCRAKVDPAEYIANTQELSQNIYDESIILGNYAKYLSNYWTTLNDFNSNGPGIKTDFDAEDAVKRADEWIEKNSDKTRNDMDKAYENIKVKYSELSSLKIKDNSLSDISESLDVLYNAYIELYDTATNPSGTAKEYTASIRDNLQVISNEYDKLNQLYEQNK